MNTNIHSDTRLCADCAEPIPTKRLAAIPAATRCVPCQLAAGDVETLKRYDEMVGEEVVSTMFTKPDQYLSVAIDRMKSLGGCNNYEYGEQ